MSKFNLKKLDKVTYIVGIVIAIGGLYNAIVGDKDMEDLSNKVKELENEVSELKNK